jgi:hypothetical protein
MIRSSTTLILFTLSLAGCSTPEGTFPSLAKRPFETNAPAAEPDSIPVLKATALPADLSAKIDALMARHIKAKAAYDAASPAVRSLANGAAGSPVGSEAWVNAQQQLSRLDKARYDSVAVQGELDELVTEQNDAESKNGTASFLDLLAPYQAMIAEDVAAQAKEIDRLAALIGNE